MRASA